MYEDIITYKKEKEEIKLDTLLTIYLKGDGEELLEYQLPYPKSYIRRSQNNYFIEYVIKGVFWTKMSTNFLNDILLRFNISMQIISIETKVIKQKKDALELKEFSSSSNLKSLKNVVFKSNINKYEDSVFWGIKLFIEHYIKKHGVGLIPYDTILNYAQNHYVDHVKDFSTLKAKCRSIWNYYEVRGWETQLEYTKKNKEEVMATRLEHVEKLAEQKTQKTKILIKAAVEYLKLNNKKITITNIAKFTKLHRNTLTKYKNYIQELK